MHAQQQAFYNCVTAQMLLGADIINGVNVQCTELVPAVAAGVIQWARTHWPAEKICESVELCDAAMLSSSQVILQFTYLVICSALQHVGRRRIANPQSVQHSVVVIRKIACSCSSKGREAAA